MSNAPHLDCLDYNDTIAFVRPAAQLPRVPACSLPSMPTTNSANKVPWVTNRHAWFASSFKAHGAVAHVQVISVATLANTTGAGAFYPNGLNGVINGAHLPR